MKILVSTDTSCLVKYDMLDKYDISVFPLNVIIDGKEYLDGITIKQEFLKNEMRQNKVVKTSTPPLGMIIEYFEKIFDQGYDHVIHFTISSKLSSMYNLFLNVSQEYFQNKITVIDSYALSSLMLTQVLYTYEEIQKGTSIEKICEIINDVKNDNYIIFVPENLNALKNGGRISPAIATIANAIGIKPLILFKDGELVKDSMVKNVKRTFSERIDMLKEKYPSDIYDYCLVTFDANRSTVDYILKHLHDTIGERNTMECLIPINVCAHCGPGTIGLIVTRKIGKKTLVEYLQ